MTNFWNNESGNFAVTAALLAMPLVAASGMAIDMTATTSAKRANQDALDAAVLAAVRAPDSATAKELLAKAYQVNGGSGELVDIVFTNTANERAIKAGSSYVKKNNFGGLLGQPQTTVEVKAKAVAKPALFEMRIKPKYAKGTYRKTMRLIDVPASASPIEVAMVKYDTSGTVGTGTMSMTPDTSSFLSVTNPASLYFTMEIDPTSEYIYADTKLNFATNDPATSFHLFVDGKQLPGGVAVNIADYVPCGATALFEWEDGGNFSAQDFGFEVTGKCKVDGGSPVAMVE